MAALHATLLPQSFLAELGAGFLRVLYRRILLDDHSFVQVVRQDRRVVAFVAGTQSTTRLYRQFARHDLLRASAAAAPVMLRRARHVLETFRYGRAAPVADLPEAELLALAVLPEARGQGLGALLVSSFQAELTRRGTTSARVVVSGDNAAAIATYRSAGFETAARIQVHRGHASEVLRWP